MALPKYDKSKRKSNNYIQLPKGAYVIVIKGVKMDKWPSGDERIAIAFDIAEGEYKGLYQSQFDSDTRSGKQWPYDAVFNLNVPTDSSEPWVWDAYNSFFADLEDSNNGFVFSGDLKTLKGKVIGGKFHNRQTEKDGNIYDHIVMKWTCIADDVRNNRAGKLPNDKLIGAGTRASGASSSASSDSDGFMDIPDGTVDEELPF
jgi:hypothetical protein